MKWSWHPSPVRRRHQQPAVKQHHDVPGETNRSVGRETRRSWDVVRAAGRRRVDIIQKGNWRRRTLWRCSGLHLVRGNRLDTGSVSFTLVYFYGLQNQFCSRGAGKSLARPTSRCILFDGENISFDASLVIYINSTNIPPIMITNRIYETQNLLSL